MIKVIIMQGLPGSGKSKHVSELREKHLLDGWVVFVCSADFYFNTPEGYKYVREKAGEAHKQCVVSYLKPFAHQVCFDEPKGTKWLVIVDNTNTRYEDIHFYWRIAAAFDADPEIHYIHCDAETAFTRNVHGVPMSDIVNMENNLKFYYTRRESFPTKKFVDGKEVDKISFTF